MKMRRMILSLLLLCLLMTGCGSAGTEGLSLDTVCQLAAEKGETLTWDDFSQYPSTETGSGLYILIYDVDEEYQVWIGGVPDEAPMYIRLVAVADTDNYIDIRYEDIEAFLNSTK